MTRRFAPSAGTERIFWISLGIVLLCAMGALDYITGPELSFTFFYLIAVTTLGAGGKYGTLCAFGLRTSC